ALAICLPIWECRNANIRRLRPPATCRITIAFLFSRVLLKEISLAVVVPFESQPQASIDRLVGLVAGDMERVNATILSRTGSAVAIFPEVADHLTNSVCKRLRPMLTLAMAQISR